MSDGRTPREAARDIDWRIPVYVLAGAAAILFVGSFTGGGHGLFGWGFMAATMWVWFLLVIAGLVLLGFFLGRQGSRRDG